MLIMAWRLNRLIALGKARFSSSHLCRGRTTKSQVISVRLPAPYAGLFWLFDAFYELYLQVQLEHLLLHLLYVF